MKFLHLLGAERCVTVEHLGQYVLETCTVTGAEGMFSGLEPESWDAWCKEHEAAHDRYNSSRRRREDLAYARAHANHVYRTTSPGHPARRGIGAYL